MEQPQQQAIPVLYIVGLGRSGSTLLDLVLSSSHQVFSVGELYRFHEMVDEDVPCSCGSSLKSCAFWGDLARQSADYTVVNHVTMRDYLSMLAYACNPFQKQVGFKQWSENAPLLRQIWNKLPGHARYILDSSKEVGRLVELDRDEQIDLHVIHIIRDGRAVANTFGTYSKKGKKNFYMSLAKWILGNLLTDRYLNKRKLNAYTLHYEAFCRDPEHYLKDLADEFNITIPEDYVHAVRSMNDYHNVGGNRVALKSNRGQFSGIVCDEKWKTQRSWLTKTVATVLVAPIQAWFLRNAR